MTQAANFATTSSNVNSSGVVQPAVGGTGLSSPGTTGNVLTSNGSAWVSSAPTAGKILQVVSASPTLSFSTSSGSFTSTGLTASITPSSATSKILILINGIFDTQSSNFSTEIAIYRGGSAVFTTGGQYAASAGYLAVFNSPQYLDSPATTSSTTYTLYTRVSAGAGTTSAGSKATITLMEIAP